MGRTTVIGLGLAAAVVAALAAWARRRRGDRVVEPPPARREWRCVCGQEYLVAGTDRHRIYWMAGATPGEPLLEARCVNCGAHLPAEHEGVTVER